MNINETLMWSQYDLLAKPKSFLTICIYTMLTWGNRGNHKPSLLLLFCAKSRQNLSLLDFWAKHSQPFPCQPFPSGSRWNSDPQVLKNIEKLRYFYSSCLSSRHLQTWFQVVCSTPEHLEETRTDLFFSCSTQTKPQNQGEMIKRWQADKQTQQIDG